MFFSKRSRQPITWLLVFLGNPGAQYDNSRHNVGYLTADALSRRVKKRIQRVKFKSWVADFDYGGVHVLAMKPTTYMNLSGEAVREAAAFYKIPPERVLVVCDDISLPVGKLRLRRHGSAGGHNGLKSIIGQLHSDQFPRLKIAWVRNPTRTTTWLTGSWATSPPRTPRSWTRRRTGPVTPSSACSPRAWTGPWPNLTDPAKDGLFYARHFLQFKRTS